mgnify:FL=1
MYLLRVENIIVLWGCQNNPLSQLVRLPFDYHAHSVLWDQNFGRGKLGLPAAFISGMMVVIKFTV